MTVRLDIMGAHRCYSFELIDHHRFRDYADEAPAPSPVFVDRLQHGPARNTAEAIADRRQAQAPNIDPIAPVEAAAKLALGHIGQRHRAVIVTTRTATFIGPRTAFPPLSAAHPPCPKCPKTPIVNPHPLLPAL